MYEFESYYGAAWSFLLTLTFSVRPQVRGKLQCILSRCNEVEHLSCSQLHHRSASLLDRLSYSICDSHNTVFKSPSFREDLAITKIQSKLAKISFSISRLYSRCFRTMFFRWTTGKSVFTKNSCRVFVRVEKGVLQSHSVKLRNHGSVVNR